MNLIHKNISKISKDVLRLFFLEDEKMSGELFSIQTIPLLFGLLWFLIWRRIVLKTLALLAIQHSDWCLFERSRQC